MHKNKLINAVNRKEAGENTQCVVAQSAHPGPGLRLRDVVGPSTHLDAVRGACRIGYRVNSGVDDMRLAIIRMFVFRPHVLVPHIRITQ